MEELQSLMAQRDVLEIEAEAIKSELTSSGVNGALPPGLSGPLVDAEGFPRGDIDIYNVKNKRKRWNEINTDHKILMKKIEEKIAQVYATDSNPEKVSISVKKPTNEATDIINTSEPIAKLDQILNGSPASDAGIQDGDYLMQFGKINMSNADGMAFRLIAGAVNDSVNTEIIILVRRNGIIKELKLVPKTWDGRGLLGCHLSPMIK